MQEELLPPEFLAAYNRLTVRSATPHEYLNLCKLAVRIIDSGQTTKEQRSEMAYVLADITAPSRLNKHAGDIQEAFLDFEIPGDFDLEVDIVRGYWESFRHTILTTDDKDTREPLKEHSQHVPAAFSKHTHKLLAQSDVTKREFLALCLLAIKYFEKDKDDTTMQSNIAYHITDLWYRKPKLYRAKALYEIGKQFSEWEKPGSFNMGYILDGHNWEKLKKIISESAEKYSAKITN